MSEENRVALVTGANGGLGSVMATALLSAGMRVVVAGTSLEKSAAMFGKHSADRCRAVAADLRDPRGAENLAAEAIAAFGRVDILINNAAANTSSLENARPDRPMPLAEIPTETIEAIYRINVLAPIRLTCALLPPMLARRWGRIINISTGLGTMLTYSGYGGSKAALEAETASLSAQLEGSGVTANMLLPGGAVVSGMTRDFAPEALLSPGIMAAPVRFLASDASSAVNGKRIRARFWDDTLPPVEAAGIAEPIAWRALAEASANPPDRADPVILPEPK